MHAQLYFLFEKWVGHFFDMNCHKNTCRYLHLFALGIEDT